MKHRFVFRMCYFSNLETYLADGRLYAKNHDLVQKGHRISFDEIVLRRGSAAFTTPCGSNVNDFVPFYFSPKTKMALSIDFGNVDLRAPDGQNLGTASLEDVAYIVARTDVLFEAPNAIWFTDIACNSGIPPVYANGADMLENHVDWELFDEVPIAAKIPEIGYEGVCSWQHDRDAPSRYQQRSAKRMAEFLVKDYLDMADISCIVLKTSKHVREVQAWVDASEFNTPIHVKPSCFY